MWHAIRPAMLSWWRRVGLWLVLVLVALGVWQVWGGIVLMLESWRDPDPGLVNNYLRGFWLFTVPSLTLGLGVTGLWLWAASVGNRLCLHSAAARPGIDTTQARRARYLICLTAGLIPLALLWAVKLAELAVREGLARWIDAQAGSFYYALHHAPPSPSAMDVLATIPQLFPRIIAGFWLIGLLVLLERGTRLAWQLYAAAACGTLLAFPAMLTFSARVSGAGELDELVRWPMAPLLGFLVLGGMFYGFATGWQRLGAAMHCVLVIAFLAAPALGYFHSLGGPRLVTWAAQLVYAATSFWGQGLLLWQIELNVQELTETVCQWWSIGWTVSGYVADIVVFLSKLLWVALMYAVMYYVVMALPERDSALRAEA